MKLIKFVEEKFWLTLIIALVVGLLFPNFGKSFNFLVLPFLAIILFLTYLKIDFMEIIAHIKKPAFLIYILILFLLLIPTVIFVISQLISPELAIGFLLLSSMPAGVASPLFTNLVKGNTSLTVVISLISHLVAFFTVPLLFFLFTKKILAIDIWNLSKTLLILSFAPLLLAQFARKTKPKIIRATQHYYNFISILIIGFLAYITIAIQSNEILRNPIGNFLNILWLYLLFIFFHIAGYFAAFWRDKNDKIALSVAKTYMNNSLAIGLALTFFTPQTALTTVLSQIPWNTTLGPFKYLLKYLK